MNEAIAKAVDELIARKPQPATSSCSFPASARSARRPRSLRKSALNKAGHTEILPLYSRLSAEEQDRVFERGAHRRIVLATNVAETSLTVPGIHFVIDTGLARVKRYSPRQKIDQLRIEPISQAAARQRAGRCGRVASGIAIRLYAEDNFNDRPEFTTPEILRTSLASVILRMAALELGPISEFPFIEPPTPRQIEDGYRQLFELGAIDDNRSLTTIGHELARLPVDPKIGRLLLASREFHCLSEMVILAAALSIQDPRDRPQALREQSDRAHEEFRDEPRISPSCSTSGNSSTRNSSTRNPTASSTRRAASISSRTCGCASGVTSPDSFARWLPSSRSATTPRPRLTSRSIARSSRDSWATSA